MRGLSQVTRLYLLVVVQCKSINYVCFKMCISIKFSFHVLSVMFLKIVATLFSSFFFLLL